MPRIASVVFRGGGKVYQFDAGSLEVAPGDRVVVDTTRGADFGRLVKGPDEVPPEQAPRGLKRIRAQGHARRPRRRRLAPRRRARGQARLPRSSSPSSAST